MKLKTMFRAMGAKDVALDKEKRTLEFPFSSEYPVDRWFGEEILSHEVGSADLSRLNDGHPLLWNHKSDTVIGVVETAELRGDKRIWAKVRFSQNAKAQEVIQDIEDGILKNVSFGYQIKEMKLTKKADKGDQDQYTATKWLPFEVSIVSVPADPTVGIGRADGDEEREVRIINEQARSLGEKRAMDDEQKKAEAARVEAAEKQIRTDAAKAERLRTSAIMSLCEKFKMPDLARELIDGDKTIEQAREAVLEKMGSVQKPVTERDADIGLTQREIKEFSFMRAIRALVPHASKADIEAASFEREVSDAASKRSGKTPQGILVPFEVLRHQTVQKRDLLAGTASAGGYAVATDLMGFIDLLRNKSVVQRLGAQVLNGLQGNISIPKLTGAATAYWIAENAAPTESQQTLGQVAMSPKTVGAYTDISRRLLIQASVDVENMVKGDLAKVLALAIDAKSLYGDGSSNTITGVRSATGLNTADFAAADPTFAEIISMESKVAADNADVGTLKYAVNALGRGALKSTEKFSSTGQTIWEQGNTVNGYACEVSNQVSLLSTVDQDYWFGNWADLILGFWSGLDIMVDPYTGSKEGTVRVVCLQDVDCAVRHGESFCYGNKTIA
ncbi:MAG TPA: phage major capsid protein [Rhodothermia bacterium]